MRTFTTPVLQLLVNGIDITAHTVYVTLAQDQVVVTKTGNDISMTYTAGIGTTIDVPYTQRETALFNPIDMAEIQVNWVTSGSLRGATEIEKIYIRKNLLREII